MTEPSEPLPAEAELVFDQEPAPEPAPDRRPPWALVLAGLAGLAVGAVVVGGIWLANGTGRTVDTRPITAPVRIGEYVQFDQIDLLKKPTSASQADRDRQRMQESTKLLSQSHGGAGVVFAHYSSQDLDTQLILQAYRDRSPFPLFLPYADAADLGMVKPSQTVERVGEVSCIVMNDPTPEGQTPAPDSAHVIKCARATDILTVEIAATNSKSFNQPEKLAELVDEVWASVS